MRIFKKLLILSSLTLLVSCGDNQGSQSPDAGPLADAPPVLGVCEGNQVAFENLFDCVVSAQCQWTVRCGSFDGTQEECETQFSGGGQGNFPRFADAIDKNLLSVDESASAVCVQGIASLSCEGGFVAPDECNDVFVGTVTDGGSCFLSEECSGLDARCLQDNSCRDDQCCMGICKSASATLGSCAAGEHCQQGDHCVQADSVCYTGEADALCQQNSNCDRGLYCKDSACTPKLALNAVCTNNRECARPYTCVGESDPGTNALCLAVDTEAAACDDLCGEEYYCDGSIATVGQCKKKGMLSEACDNTKPCEKGLSCGSADGLCYEARTLGESCGDALGLVCGEDLFCPLDTKVCTARLAQNAACEEGQCQEELFCNAVLSAPPASPVCMAPGAANEACAKNAHCESLICNQATKMCEDYLNCFQ